MKLLKHKQEFKHDPDNGLYGDCWRTVVACLLGLPRGEVPHVCDGPDDGLATKRMRDFLASRGCAMIQIPIPGEVDLDTVLTAAASYSGGLHYALMGTSKTGCNHVVICKDDAIVHDTSLTDSGIVGPSSDGFWWLEWYVSAPRIVSDDPSQS